MESQDRYNQLVRVVERYVRALSALDGEACRELFADGCVIRDPIGIQEYKGKVGLAQNIEEKRRLWHYYRVRADNFYPGERDSLALRWSVSATAQNGKIAEFSGISIFYFADTQIKTVDSYWDRSGVLKDIS